MCWMTREILNCIFKLLISDSDITLDKSQNKEASKINLKHVVKYSRHREVHMTDRHNNAANIISQKKCYCSLHWWGDQLNTFGITHAQLDSQPGLTFSENQVVQIQWILILPEVWDYRITAHWSSCSILKSFMSKLLPRTCW
jgi:hypothetical protein